MEPQVVKQVAMHKLIPHQDYEFADQVITLTHMLRSKLVNLILQLARYSLPLTCKLFGIVCMASNILEDRYREIVYR